MVRLALTGACRSCSQGMSFVFRGWVGAEPLRRLDVDLRGPVVAGLRVSYLEGRGLPAGAPFSEELRISEFHSFLFEPWLRPGTYTATFTGCSLDAHGNDVCTKDEPLSLVLSAPPEGITSRSWMSLRRNGAEIDDATRGQKAWANFEFGVMPRRGPVEVIWVKGGKVFGRLRKPLRKRVHSHVGTDGRGGLKGSWILVVGGVVVDDVHVAVRV